MQLKNYVQTNGDFLTLTVREYQQLKGWEKLTYHLYHNPIFLFLLITPFLFLLMNCFANPKATQKERLSVYCTNMVLVGIILMLGFGIGFIPLIVILGSTLFFSLIVGVWLFYIQHQFEQAYWASQDEWDFVEASLKGSSFYKLPGVLQWFTGNIGLHQSITSAPKFLTISCKNATGIVTSFNKLL